LSPDFELKFFGWVGVKPDSMDYFTQSKEHFSMQEIGESGMQLLWSCQPFAE
jgi:hypothetical protein